jgi:hypothetical protein
MEISMDLHTDRLKLAEVFPDIAKTWAKRLHIKADAIDYVRKGIPIDPADISIEDGERAAIRLISTPHIDRDGEILVPSGCMMDDFRKNPVCLYAHDYAGLPIGKDIWIKPTNKGILAKTVYANHQFAQDVYGCVKDGFLNTSSAGFIPVEVVSNGEKGFDAWQAILEKDYGITRDESGQAKRMYTKWALLEHSDCPVPSNAACLNLLVGKSISARLKKDMGVPEPDINPDMKPDEPAIKQAESITSSDTNLDMESVTKPETTDNYRRIPVDEGDHSGHKIRTMDISAEKGIKALYCVDCKKIITYLFDKDKFTMAEAQAWVADHKPGKSEAFTGPEFAASPDAPISAPVETVPVTEKGTDVPEMDTGAPLYNLGKLTVDIKDLREFKEIAGDLRVVIADLKSAIPAPVEKDDSMSSLPYMLADLLTAVHGLQSSLDAIQADLEAEWEAPPEVPAESVAITETPVPQAKDEPVPEPAPPAPSQGDIAKTIREVLSELNIKAILKESVHVELAKLRGRVE